MSDINKQLTALIQTYILTYNQFIESVNSGVTVVSVKGTFTGSGQQFFTTQSENECASIIENSIKTNTNGKYTYIGSYVDNLSRYIPQYIENVKSVENAIEVARKNNATVFGIQNNGELFINTESLNVALAKAKLGGPTICGNELGCRWVNQIYALEEGVYAGGTYNDGTCSLYTNGTFTSGSDSVIVDIEIYYEETLKEILENIQTLINESDSDLEVKYNELLKLLSGSDNISIIERVSAQKNQLIKFAKQNDLITEQNNDSFDKLRKENITFRIWVFIFLFVLFLTFQLFTNPILKSISYVCLVFMVTIIISIIRLLNPLLFMIIILFVFLSTVLTLFYKENYPLSISILIIGSIVFAVVYRL